FLNPTDIGGRYSALSYFGLVPAALIGIDAGQLLHRAHRMAEACAAWVPAGQNPAAWLGAILAEAALAGRNKTTFVLSRGIGSFGLWVEQLIAESTGKEGKGILPVAAEPLGPPEVYGRDRVFVSLTLTGEEADPTEAGLHALMAAGHPVVRLSLEDRYDLGQEFFRWEFATAVAGAIMGINAFDQPNVAESKQNTKDVLAGHQPPTAPVTATELDRFLTAVRPGDYLAFMAYLPPTPQNDRRLAAARGKLRDRLKVATTLGYGPRFLHSTGQLHKGGPPIGHFLPITVWETGGMSLDQYLDHTVFHRARPFSREDFRAFMLSQSVAFPETIAVARDLARTGRYRMMTINNESAELNAYRLHVFGLRDIF